MKFTVSATPGMNKLKGRWAFLNWKKKYHRELRNYYLLAPKVKVKTVMKIQRFGSRIFDVDNYYGGVKSLVDTIKELGLIADDSAKWCEIIFLPQVKCKRGLGKTEVEITKR